MRDLFAYTAVTEWLLGYAKIDYESLDWKNNDPTFKHPCTGVYDYYQFARLLILWHVARHVVGSALDEKSKLSACKASTQLM